MRNSADAVADHGPERRDVLRRPPQLPGQERAAADGDHLGRRDHERHLRVHLREIAYGMGVPYMPASSRRRCPARRRGRPDSSRATRSCRSAIAMNPTFMQLKGGVTLGDMENGIPLHRASRGGRQEIEPITLKPKQEQGELATIGVSRPQSLSCCGNGSRRR